MWRLVSPASRRAGVRALCAAGPPPPPQQQLVAAGSAAAATPLSSPSSSQLRRQLSLSGNLSLNLKRGIFHRSRYSSSGVATEELDGRRRGGEKSDDDDSGGEEHEEDKRERFVIVTGGASGIGRAVAHRFLEADARTRVAIFDRKSAAEFESLAADYFGTRRSPEEIAARLKSKEIGDRIPVLQTGFYEARLRLEELKQRADEHPRTIMSAAGDDMRANIARLRDELNAQAVELKKAKEEYAAIDEQWRRIDEVRRLGQRAIANDTDEEYGEGENSRARYWSVDVSDRQAVRSAVEEVAAWADDSGGSIEVLVNNAGIVRDGQLCRFRGTDSDGGGKSSSLSVLTGELPEELFDQVMDVHVKGTFNCAQAVVPHFVGSGRGGVIVNASSVVALDGNFGQTSYVGAKCAILGMTEVWSRELGKYGVRVNAVCPGFISTEMLETVPSKILEKLAAGTPLQRLGQPHEVANAYHWLCSDEASFVSGATLRVDGGLRIGT